MNTQLSIQVKAEPEKVLACAYETLLSMCVDNKKGGESNFIESSSLFAFIDGKFKPPSFTLAWKYACILTVKNIANNICDLEILVGVDENSLYNTGKDVKFISEFFKQFLVNIKQ